VRRAILLIASVTLVISVAKKILSSLLHKASHELRNLIRCGIEREMARIEDVDFGLQDIFAVTFRFAGVEGEVILTSNHQ
jgi:hypothetical protein